MLEFGGRCPFRCPLLPAVLAGLLLSWPAAACECYWVGPFLTVAPRAETIVRGRVLAYHPGESGPAPLQAMDVEILDVWKGEVPSPILRVWGDNGGLCRPDVTQFPLGTEWLLALNGPGSKPGMSPGPAISVCGTYWLEVRGGMARGNVDVAGEMTAAQELPLAEVRRRLAAACAADDQAPSQALPAAGGGSGARPAIGAAANGGGDPLSGASPPPRPAFPGRPRPPARRSGFPPAPPVQPPLARASGPRCRNCG